MSETIGQAHAGRLAQAYSLAAARGWVLARRPITVAELAAGAPLADGAVPAGAGGIEQGATLIAYFVRRERLVLPASIVLIGGRELLDWAMVNVARSQPRIVRELFGGADGETILVLTAAGAPNLRS